MRREINGTLKRAMHPSAHEYRSEIESWLNPAMTQHGLRINGHVERMFHTHACKSSATKGTSDGASASELRAWIKTGMRSDYRPSTQRGTFRVNTGIRRLHVCYIKPDKSWTIELTVSQPASGIKLHPSRCCPANRETTRLPLTIAYTFASFPIRIFYA